MIFPVGELAPLHGVLPAARVLAGLALFVVPGAPGSCSGLVRRYIRAPGRWGRAHIGPTGAVGVADGVFGGQRFKREDIHGRTPW